MRFAPTRNCIIQHKCHRTSYKHCSCKQNVQHLIYLHYTYDRRKNKDGHIVPQDANETVSHQSMYVFVFVSLPVTRGFSLRQLGRTRPKKMEKPRTNRLRDELRSTNCRLERPTAVIMPNNVQNSAPRTGSGNDAKRALNFPTIPSSSISAAPY